MDAAENQIVVYQPNETVRLDVRLENETVWLTQAKLGVLFGVDRTVVNRHIHNIYKTGELEETATCAKIAQVQNEGGRSITRIVPFYNLDMIIAVGYRVNSLQATRFRQWATQVLREYLLRGYSVNARMNLLEDKVDRGAAVAEHLLPEQVLGREVALDQVHPPGEEGADRNRRLSRSGDLGHAREARAWREDRTCDALQRNRTSRRSGRNAASLRRPSAESATTASSLSIRRKSSVPARRSRTRGA